MSSQLDADGTKDELPFSPPFIPEDAITAVVECLRSGWVGTGPLTAQFEADFAAYLGATSAAAVSSCTSGLQLSLQALGISAGDEVITSSMTFCSTVNVIVHAGATPVLVDVDPETKNLSLDAVARAISPATRAVIPVHYAGYPVDMGSLADFCQASGLLLVEDCAHAVEAMSSGRHVGLFGDAGVFSFYATKNLAIGEGGMVVSDSADLISRVAQQSLHGLTRDAWKRFSVSGRKTYDISGFGYKANMTDLQSSIGIVQLRNLETNYVRRKEIWNYYLRELQGTGVELPKLPEGVGDRHALHLFTVGLPKRIDRDQLVQEISETEGLALGIHYKAIPDFKFYQQQLGIQPADFPVATAWGRSCVSLSISPRLTDGDVERVVSSLKGKLS